MGRVSKGSDGIATLNDAKAIYEGVGFGTAAQAGQSGGQKQSLLWKYILLPHDAVDRTASFDYLIATH